MSTTSQNKAAPLSGASRAKNESVALLLTLTLPSRFHPVKRGRGGSVVPNENYCGASPRDGQQWLKDMWAKLRDSAARKELHMRGLRVAEPHHDGMPHWHTLVWVESESAALQLSQIARVHWLSDCRGGPDMPQNYFRIQRLESGVELRLLTKCLAKRNASFDLWAKTWGIRQISCIGGFKATSQKVQS